MEILKDLEELEKFVKTLQAQGKPLTQGESNSLATAVRQDLKDQKELNLFETISSLAQATMPLLTPILSLI